LSFITVYSSLPQFVPIEEVYPPEWINPTTKKMEFVPVPVRETWAGMEVGTEVGREGGRVKKALWSVRMEDGRRQGGREGGKEGENGHPSAEHTFTYTGSV